MARARMPRKPSKKRVEAALEALAGVRRDWHRRPGVTAVDVGYKIRDKEMTSEVALRMHVKRKLPRAALPDHELVTSSAKPKKVGDFPIDVIEADYAPADLGPQMIEAEAVDRRSRVDPLIGGVSVGNPRITAGTLGAIVWDRGDGEACILSNWHVLCGDPACVAGETILQPGPFDGGRPADKVAELKRFRLDSDADAALARLTGERDSSRDILGLAPIPGIDTPALGMLVSKSGRTTGNTEGVIDGVGLSTTINYGSVVQSFSQQIHIVPRPPWPTVDYELSKGGDSGSVWINDASGNAVGLHFAGESDPSPSAENAIANRMEKVAEELNFQFTPVFRPPPPLDDDDLRDLIRRIICARFPFLCFGGFPSFFPGPQSASAQATAPPTCGCGGQQAQQAAYGGGMDPSAVEAVVDQIVAELRRSR